MNNKDKIIGKKKFGFGKEAETLLENLAMLVDSGASLSSALSSLVDDIKSQKLKKAILKIINQISEGIPFWQAIDKSGIYSVSTIILIKSGEEGGTLSENLDLAAKQVQKNRLFKSHIQSAMLYPSLVLGLAIVVGLTVAWFILPRLTSIFSGMKVDLPLPTRILISLGDFIQDNKFTILIFTLVASLLFFVLIVWVKIFRDLVFAIIRKLPGIKKLVKEIEISRMGYIAGTLLEAGLPVEMVFISLQESTNDRAFKKLYSYLEYGITQGESFKTLLSTKNKKTKLLPNTVRSLISTGEKSGYLSKSFLQISKVYEEKVDTTSKNLSVILEPILLIGVWLIVVVLALAIILPIYSLISNINDI